MGITPLRFFIFLKKSISPLTNWVKPYQLSPMNLTLKAILLRRLLIAAPAVSLYLVGCYQDDNFFIAAIFAFLIGESIAQVEKILRS
jgi:hypothetical protein